MGRVQEVENAVEAFGGELVIGKGSEKLRDQYIDRIMFLRHLRCRSAIRMERMGGRRPAWAFPGTHVGTNELHLILPQDRIVTLKKYKGIGVFFQGPHLNGDAGVFAGL